MDIMQTRPTPKFRFGEEGFCWVLASMVIPSHRVISAARSIVLSLCENCSCFFGECGYPRRLLCN